MIFKGIRAGGERKKNAWRCMRSFPGPGKWPKLGLPRAVFAYWDNKELVWSLWTWEVERGVGHRCFSVGKAGPSTETQSPAEASIGGGLCSHDSLLKLLSEYHHPWGERRRKRMRKCWLDQKRPNLNWQLMSLMYMGKISIDSNKGSRANLIWL